MATPYQRVSKQMIQMFGPQWTEKFGIENKSWEDRLKDLEYAQISAGLKKVLHGALKFYEIDLPRFMELCKPPRAPTSPEASVPDWMEDMCQEEIDMHCYANLKMLSWCCRHKVYGLPPYGDGKSNLTKEQNKQLWDAARRISHDFFLMREELGKENVPQEDFLKALEMNWERIVRNPATPGRR